ncbi:MAG: RNA polymerase sigma factor, partial [Actinobacteria bacterium]|nr:RNA polymerase sigma factor [Actinomycetota bacterium]
MALPSLPPEQQEALVAALKRGSPDAFARFYEAFHGRIYNLAARMVGDREDAADITQEVFLTAYRRLPGHRGEMRLEPWLYRVAVNACYDHLRRRSRRPADALPDADALPAPIDEVERAQLSAAVCEALDQVTPRYRAALLLKDIHGCDNGEVADILDIGTGTAGVLLFRARKAFQKAFGKVAGDSPVNVSAIGLAAFLPELPVPESLAAPPAFLAASAAGLADVTPSILDTGGPLLDPAVGIDVARLPLDPGPAEPLSTGPLLNDPSGPLASLGALAPAGPLAASAAAATGTKAGSAVLAKIVLAVVGMTALAGGGVAVGTLESPPSPPVEQAMQTAEPSTGDGSGSSSDGPAIDAEDGRSRLLRPGDGDALARRAQSGAGRTDDEAARGEGYGNGGGNGAGG